MAQPTPLFVGLDVHRIRTFANLYDRACLLDRPADEAVKRPVKLGVERSRADPARLAA